jgi:hypothetical protein
MSFRIEGWPEGHPHLTPIDAHPFGYPQPKNPNPLLDAVRSAYRSTFQSLYKSYPTKANKQARVCFERAGFLQSCQSTLLLLRGTAIASGGQEAQELLRL